ncbi:MAG TPA: autotransporter-associated beta strand repeat-containing protein [Verrucomicrobiae bacterium]|nr:autotransporter-associated beta strand repeat-containing protein [Verrucomicrobiae bacterium]HEV2438187.1 autotransporter-associated beta strand repeat-containing protein [Verrucomicrobiae bacterium]
MKTFIPYLKPVMLNTPGAKIASSFSRLFAAAIFAFGGFAGSVATAQNNDTWVGNTDVNWNTAANWLAGTAPVAGDSLFFGTAGTSGTSLTNDITAGTSFAGLTYNSGASAFLFNGNTIALTGGITNSSGSTQTNNLAITLNANVTLNDGGGGTTLGGAISGSFGLTNAGSGMVTLSSVNNPLTGGVTINNGTLQVAGSGGNSALGKGNTTVNSGGTLVGTSADAFGYPSHNNPATILINGGTVTDLGTATNNITLPNLTFTGGTLTSDPGNPGVSGHTYSFNGNNTVCTVTTLPASSTATISANGIITQRKVTFDIAAGTVTGGPTPGVDMLVSSPLLYTSGHNGTTKIGAGTLALSGTNTYGGGAVTLVNQGVLALTGSGSIASPIYVTNGATFDVSGLSSPFALAAGQTLGGNGAVTGGVTAASSIVNAGYYGGSTLTFESGLTLGGGATLDFVLSGTTNGANSKIAVAGNLNDSGANTISLSGFVSLQNGTYPLITYGSETPGGTWTVTGFTAGTQTASIVDSNHAINLVIAPLSGVTNLTWVGDGAANNWDTTSSNWLNGANPAGYSDGDEVTFNDFSTNTLVTLVGTLQPAAILVTNNSRDYIFSTTTSPSGLISGSAGVVKLGSGKLTMAEGSDSFSGGIIIGGGTLILSNALNSSVAIAGGLTVTNGSAVLDQFGAISGNALIGSGATAQVGVSDTYGALPTGTTTLNGNLVFNRTDAFSVTNVISGGSTGELIVTNLNNVTLSGANTFAGNILVSSGTLTDGKVGASDGSAGGLGAATAGRAITVASGATLILAQNTFGGASVVNASLPSIVINGGTVSDLTKYTTLGNVTLNNGANLTQDVSATGTYQGYQFLGSVTVGGSSYSTITSENGVNDHLGSNTVFDVTDVTGDSNPDLFVNTGLQNQSGDFSTAPGSLTKTGAGTMQLSGVNTYTGNTTINVGTLALSGSASLNSSVISIAGGATFDVSGLTTIFALASGQTLSNSTSTAVLNGSADASVGTVSLTSVSGTPSLTVANGTLTLASTSVFKINNTGPALASGSYKIISAATAGSVAGTAPSSVSVNGGGIAAGATASLQINSGELYLVVSTPPTPRFTGIGVSGTTLTITATNGAANGTYVLLESTNVATPLTNWVPVLTNTFDGSGNLNLSTNIVNPNNPRAFFILSE